SGAIPKTTSMMSFEFGDVVLVPFPFTNQAASKKRPAVDVSSHAYNTARLDVVVMAITSQVRMIATSDDLWVQSWKAAGLLKPSVVKPVFATIEQSLVIRQLGALDTTDKQSLRQAIARILG
ncbi:MAG: type II toxin-antitoxin system PemK/MazF family toxin, partial [Xanthobacteraceae bacterium]